MINHPEHDQDAYNNGTDIDFGGWSHLGDFWAFPERFDDCMIRVVVGIADNDAGDGHGHRVFINHPEMSQETYNEGQCADFGGWTHHMAFWAFPTREFKFNNVRLALGKNEDNSRCIMNHPEHSQEDYNNGQDVDFGGWEPYFSFWAPGHRVPGAIRIAYGHAFEPAHRLMINHPEHDQDAYNNGTDIDFGGWSHLGDFWAFPERFDDCMIRVVVGIADNDAGDGHGHRVFVQHPDESQEAYNDGLDLGFGGWTPHMSFWAFPDCDSCC